MVNQSTDFLNFCSISDYDSVRYKHVGWKQEDSSEMSAEEGVASPAGLTDKLL